MTIQKLSSGSKKNCRFFWVCRDFAGFVGQNVLEDRRHGREKEGDTPRQDDQPVTTLDMYLGVWSFIATFPCSVILQVQRNETLFLVCFNTACQTKPCNLEQQ